MNVVMKPAAATRRTFPTAPAAAQSSVPSTKSEDNNSIDWGSPGYESGVSLINTEPLSWTSPEPAHTDGKKVGEYGSGYHVSGTIAGGRSSDAQSSDSPRQFTLPGDGVTPMVSGRVALLLELEPDLTPAQVKERMIEEFGHIVS